MSADLSIKIIEAVLDLTVGSSNNKLVLLVLANYTNDQGRCWPSIATLTKKTELSERTVQRALAQLQRGGFLEVIHMPGHSNVFVIHTGATWTSGGARVTPPGVTVWHPRGVTVTPITVKDPSFEPSKNPKREIPLETVGERVQGKEAMHRINTHLRLVRDP